MKFLFAENLDFIDPNYDFLNDRSAPNRRIYWDDEFPHEYMGEASYDGLLISRAVVGDHKFPGQYTQAQAMRLRREGARRFFRLDKPEFEDLLLFGDCGAFSYSDLDVPPYTPTEILEFYDDCGFSHGCSVDHVIFEFDRNLVGMKHLPDMVASEKALYRFNVTLENAEIFLRESSHMSYPFTPLGVVQGWSPGSMAEAAKQLVQIGYNYLAIGGLVPLNAESIHLVLRAIRESVPSHIRLHLLGFGKIDHISDFMDYGIASIDTTSPLVRAFKDNYRNFFMPGSNGLLRYYAAIRIPHATESRALSSLVKKNYITQENLQTIEQSALSLLRAFDNNKANIEEVLLAIMEYVRIALTDVKTFKTASKESLQRLEAEYLLMLTELPWKECDCMVCQKCGVEVAIFRSSNRNKRRGFHNIYVFNKQLRKITGRA